MTAENSPARIVREYFTRVTVEVHAGFSKAVLKAAGESGVQYIEFQQGRVVQLLEQRKRNLLPFPQAPHLAESQGEVINFLIRPDRELDLVCRIVREAGLDVPGRGSVFTEPVEVVSDGNPVFHAVPGTVERRDAAVPEGILNQLTGIVFICPRGIGNAVASTALDLGTGVPIVTLGTGTGLRDKIGLLRITIPAEKEVVSLVTPQHDAEGIVALIIEELRLNQPGRGFVYSFPVGSGLLNTRLRIGQQRHAATIEQIIAAIDGLRYGTEWRRRFAGDEVASLAGGRRFLRDLSVLTIICNEDQSDPLIRAAMKAGSGGATSSRIRCTASPRIAGGISPARERTTMIVKEDLIQPILKAVTAEGLFTPDIAGHLEVRRCPFAYAYAGSRAK